MPISQITSNSIANGGVAQSDLAAGVAGTGPAFSVYRNGNQTVTAATFTKVQLDTEEFDTNSNFDSTTNYRFTPTVSGYYQVSAVVSFGTTSTITRALCFIAKNGNNYKTGSDVNSSVFSNVATALIYMNGSTDYLELFGWVNGAGTLTFNGNISTVSMQAVLVRGA